MVRGNTTQTIALLAVTEVGGTTHLVTADAVTIGRRLGRYVACCAVEIVAASMTTPGTGFCRRCRRWRAGMDGTR